MLAGTAGIAAAGVAGAAGAGAGFSTTGAAYVKCAAVLVPSEPRVGTSAYVYDSTHAAWAFWIRTITVPGACGGIVIRTVSSSTISNRTVDVVDGDE